MAEENKRAPQKVLFESGNELAAYAAKQINYHVMGYYPITPSTQIAENLDAMRAEGLHDISLVAAEGEHSAAGICYGASACGGGFLMRPAPMGFYMRWSSFRSSREPGFRWS